MVYCICSGDDEDWNIDYVFMDENKRDEFLKLLHQEQHSSKYKADTINFYEKCDFELNDNFDFHSVKNINYVTCKYSQDINGDVGFDFDIIRTNSLCVKKNVYSKVPTEGMMITKYSQYAIVYCLNFLADEELTKSAEELQKMYFDKCREFYKEEYKI